MTTPFEELLEDWKDFDPSNTTVHDETMASIMTVLGANQLKETIVNKNEVDGDSLSANILSAVFR